MSAMRNSTIGRSPEMPMGQSPAVRRTAQDGVRRRPQRRPGIQQVPGDPLEQACFARVDAEMMELHLRPGPRQRGGPFERGAVAMLVDDVKHRLAAFGNHGPEGDAYGRARCDTHAAAQGENRVEYGADRVRQGPAVRNRDRPMDAVAAPEETGPVGLHLRLSHSLAVHDRQMRGPDFLFARRAAPPRCQEMAPGHRIVFGGHEQLREGRVCDVVGLRRQHELGIGRHSMSRPRLPEFAIETRRTSASSSADTITSNVVVSAPSCRVISARSSSKVTCIDVWFDAARLEAGRPHIATADVAAGKHRSPCRRRWHPRANA